ncbi:MAG: hypothetical protein JO210_04100 [Acidobacteriaceae bacterium]|nr:hypothetical protein [Acidobacteriaceae bacterium]
MSSGPGKQLFFRGLRPYKEFFASLPRILGLLVRDNPSQAPIADSGSEQEKLPYDWGGSCERQTKRQMPAALQPSSTDLLTWFTLRCTVKVTETAKTTINPEDMLSRALPVLRSRCLIRLYG